MDDSSGRTWASGKSELFKEGKGGLALVYRKERRRGK